MTLTKLGKLNASWGVCGFTSSLYGLWDVLDKTRRSQMMGGTKAHRLLAEIKTYLVMLEADGKVQLKKDIETYSRAFADTDNDFVNFSVQRYIQQVNAAVGKTEKQIMADANYGIGMPPHAVVDYLQCMWERPKAAVKQVTDFYGPEHGIIGVKNTAKPLSTHYDGLEHWMYRLNQKIYSWGEEFDSVQEAADRGAEDGTKWQICCLITLD